MGTQFFWFFDIAVILLLIAFIFKGIRKGFVATIAGLLVLILAFVVSLPLSETISGAIYENIIKDAVTEEINNKINSVIDDTIIDQLNNVDMSKAKINGYELSSITKEADSAGKITLLDSSSVLDLTETGIADIDLSAFGITEETVDYSSVNLGTVEITSNELDTYGIEKMILASVLAGNLSNGTAFGSICGAIEDMAETIPAFMSGVSESVTSGDKTIIKQIVLSILDTDTNDFARSITDNMVKPLVLVPVRALIFVLLFVIIIIILNLIVKLLRSVNKIPIIGGLNKLLGAAAGVIEAAIVIFIVCIFVQVIITLSGNGLIFLNTMTIDETFLFRKIYYFEFLNFLA